LDKIARYVDINVQSGIFTIWNGCGTRAYKFNIPYYS